MICANPFFGRISAKFHPICMNLILTDSGQNCALSIQLSMLTSQSDFLTVLRIFAHIHLFGRNSTPAYPIDLKLYYLNSGDLAGSFGYPQAP